MTQPVTCAICGEVYEDGIAECSHGEYWLSEITECPVPGVNDARTRNYRRCDDGNHHWGRGDHVTILTHRNGRPRRAEMVAARVQDLTKGTDAK